VEDFVSRIVSLNEMDPEKAYELAKEVYKELKRKGCNFQKIL
jgi:2-phosphoglycerate kinase